MNEINKRSHLYYWNYANVLLFFFKYSVSHS